ncbi:MAG: bacillithiol biosynthesis cysteine-adding enzyme BshC [Myxococcota bacterium]
MQALGPAWLRGDPSAASLLEAPPFPDAMVQPSVRAPGQACREVLAALNPDAELAMDAAVVTGQQLGLFGGPCFTLYKAWTAVAWARALSKKWGIRVRAVFWLQTEDHDFAEVAWCGQPGGGRVELSDRSDHCRVSVSERLVPEEISERLRSYADSLGPCPHGEEVLAQLERCWRPGLSWTQAYCDILRWAFATEDLLLFDPRHPTAAAAVAPLHEQALFGARELETALARRAELIAGAGFRVQVPVRPETLSFVHLDGFDGGRQRLAWLESGMAQAPDGRTVSPAVLRRWLSEDPRRFTSSALLRPILQDRLLPTVAYVAGPGEAAYWAQLEPLYRAFGVLMPRVVPRARARLLEPWARRLLNRWALSPADVEVGEAALLDRMGAGQLGAPAAQVASGLAEVRSAVRARLQKQSEKLDVSGPMGALDRKLARSFERFVKKYETLRRRSDTDAYEAARRLQGSLAPGRGPQERFVGFVGYFARYGRDHVMSCLKSHWSPGEVQTVDVEL